MASSDDEAPEAVSFGSSKRSVRDEARAVQRAQEMEKQRLKERRRARDQSLKERKAQAQAKGKGKGKEKAAVVEESDEEEEEEEEETPPGGASKEELEARMERAMLEAQAESADEDSENVDMDGSGSSSDSDEASGSSSDEEDEPLPAKKSAQKSPKTPQTDYLPDHLFTSAFSHFPKSSSNPSSKPTKRTSSPAPKHARKRTKKSTDTTLGSRTIRTLPSSSHTPRGLAPTAKTTRFINNRLNVRGAAKDARVRGWERRAANVGVLKRKGPAARFVRDESD